MKILLADDAEVVRLMLGHFVRSMGHELLLATNGEEAVQMCLQSPPDLVLMDMLMPKMDGPEAGRIIKAKFAEHWVPIILVTAVEEVGKLADAMETGADDYLLKPVNFRILEAKIKAIERTVALNRKVREQSGKLAEYFERAEDEKRVATHLMEQLVSRERLRDPQLHAWIEPAESLSGDLVAAARTPGNVLHLLLADGIGHGLTAALNVLPLTQPFYAMTERGFSVADILVEMNRKVKQVLPVGHFVAMAFVSVDFANRHVEVWNGGIPPLRMFDPQGQLSQLFPSRHLALGILPSSMFDVSTDSASFDARAKLVLCSDGLIEAHNQAGLAYGEELLSAACGALPADLALASVIHSLTNFMAGKRCHDDVSLAIVDLDPDASIPLPSKAAELTLPVEGDAPQWRYALSLGAEQLREMEAIPTLMHFIGQINSLTKQHSNIFVILSELLSNAIDHGLLQMPTHLRRNAGGMSAYVEERSKRLQQLKDGRIELELAGFEEGGNNFLRIRITDSGEGFDIQQGKVGQERRGKPRGIDLVRALCTSLRYFAKGNRVEAYYSPPSPNDVTT